MNNAVAYPKNTSKSVTARALAVLGAFTVAEPSLTLSHLARIAGLPIATVFRLAGELEEGGFLDRDDAGRYSLGVKLWEMGLLTSVHGHLREIAMPFLLNLQYDCREIVQLAVRDGVDAIYVEKLTSEESIPVQSRIGARIPLHATGVGKVLLAFSPESFIEVVMAMQLPRYTEDTLTNKRVLAKDLAVIKAQGFARSHQEYLMGSTSVAAPVLVNGVIRASIGIVNYTAREDLDTFAPSLLHAATGLGRRLEEIES